MATVTRENIGVLHDKVTVKLEKDDYLPSFEKSLKQYAKSVNVPGFRKGMVPSGMIRKMYGQSIFTDEVLRTAGQKLEEYLKNEKVAIFAQPMAMRTEEPVSLDMNSPNEVDFDFEIGLKPDFEITPLKNKAKLTRYNVIVGDKILDDELERLQRRFGKVESEEVISERDHILYSTIEQCDAEGNVTEGTEKIEDTEMFDKLPATMQDLIKGKKADDTIVFRPVDVCTEEELAQFLKDPLKKGEEAKEDHFKLTITKVGKLIPHELNEELFAQVFQNEEIKDVDTFKERLRTELNKEYDRLGRERLQNEMYELLVHQTPIELPEGFLKRWMQEGGEKPKSEGEVEQEYPTFDHQLRWTLISDQLIMDNNINVTREEVIDDIKTRVLGYFGMPFAEGEEPEWMATYMAKATKDEKTMDETYRRLLYDKLFVFLEGQFDIEQKEINEEEFYKLQDPHAAHHQH